MGLLFGLGCLPRPTSSSSAEANTSGPTWSLPAVYFPGFRVTFVGSLIGLFYAFVIGYVIGHTIGVLLHKPVTPA